MSLSTLNGNGKSLQSIPKGSRFDNIDETLSLAELSIDGSPPRHFPYALLAHTVRIEPSVNILHCNWTAWSGHAWSVRSLGNSEARLGHTPDRRHNVEQPLTAPRTGTGAPPLHTKAVSRPFSATASVGGWRNPTEEWPMPTRQRLGKSSRLSIPFTFQQVWVSPKTWAQLLIHIETAFEQQPLNLGETAPVLA